MALNNLNSQSKKFHKSKGGSYLILVLVIGLILTLISFGILSMVYLQSQQSAKLVHTNQAFFAAEASLFETVRLLKDIPEFISTHSFPYSDSYTIGSATIYRTINQLPSGEYEIIVDSVSKGSQRRLIGTYTPPNSESSPLDIVLVIDRSLSMIGTSIDQAKQAAIQFINIIETQSPNTRIGLVSYSSSATLDETLTSVYDNLRMKIEDLEADGGTNISHGVNQAYSRLDLESRPEAKKAIILLSDGVSQHSYNEICDSIDPESCVSNNCIFPNTGYQPDSQGDCCSNDSITQADIAKNDDFSGNPRNYAIFSIALTSNYSSSANQCKDYYSNPLALSKTKELGRLTLLRISSEPPSQTLPPTGEQLTYYKETSNPDELEELYAQIAQSISTPAFFDYYEAEPQPLTP